MLDWRMGKKKTDEDIKKLRKKHKIEKNGTISFTEMNEMVPFFEH